MNSTIAKPQGVKKFIRFKGLIGFFTVMAVIIALLYLFAETIIKNGIEQGGGMILGAEVNVESVELNYSPLTLTINDLQATDADQPSHNLFSFQQASAGVDVWQYLLGKTIIEQLDVAKLEFMTKRASLGEVYEDSSEEEENDKGTSSMLPDVDLQLPDVNALLQTDNLQTVKAAEQLEKSYEEESKKLAVLKSKLPSKAKLQAYQVKVKAIGKMKVKSLDDFNKVKAEFDALKKSFKQDKETVKQAKEQLMASKDRLAKQVSTLKNAPNADWKAIESKYQLDSVNTEDFAHILFGENARVYYQQAEALYQRVAPFISSSADSENIAVEKSRRAGRFIHFDEENPLPDFLIKTAKLSMVLTQGDFVVDGSELTHQHWYRAKPSTITFASNNLFSTGEMKVDSQFEVAKSGDLTGSGDWVFKNLALEGIELTKSDSLSLNLTKGELAGDGDFNFYQRIDSNNITSKNHLFMKNASYQGEAKNTFSNMMLDTFKSLDTLTLDVNIDGDIADPKLSMSSSLDKALSGAFEKQISNKLSEFKGQINSGLNDKMSESLNMKSTGKTDMLNFEALLSDTDNALETLQNSDVVKQQKKKLQDKATDKLKGKLGDLFG